MYILHIETSTSICSIALSKDDELIAYRDMNEGMNHAAILAPAIQQLLNSENVLPEELTAIAVSSGPGSYTGLRVGGATGKAMAYALGKPLIAIPTLKALASAAFDQHPEARFALPMIDARRDEVYAALYDADLNELWPVSSVILNEAFFSGELPKNGQIICCGDGAAKIGGLADLAENLTIDELIRCSARHLKTLAWSQYQQGALQDPLHFVPFYLKPPNITKSKKVVNP
jgi:tRNA threonylcarbamoyladenosine biosynthesis protein TsaB